MKTPAERLKIIVANPVYSILVILAVILMVTGGYAISPFYMPGESPVFASGAGRIGSYILGIGNVLAGISMMAAVYKEDRRWIIFLSYVFFLAFLFSSVTRILSVGLFPPIWILTLGAALIAVVCRLSLEAKK